MSTTCHSPLHLLGPKQASSWWPAGGAEQASWSIPLPLHKSQWTGADGSQHRHQLTATPQYHTLGGPQDKLIWRVLKESRAQLRKEAVRGGCDQPPAMTPQHLSARPGARRHDQGIPHCDRATAPGQVTFPRLQQPSYLLPDLSPSLPFPVCLTNYLSSFSF